MKSNLHKDANDALFWQRLLRVTTGESIGSDSQIMRKFRQGEIQPLFNELMKQQRWDDQEIADKITRYDGVPDSEIGAWILVRDFFETYRDAEGMSASHQHYFNFVLAHCQLERSLLMSKSTLPSFKEWLLIIQTPKQCQTDLGMCEREIKRCLYWAALGVLDICIATNKRDSIFSPFLPKLAKGNTSIVYSSKVMITEILKKLSDGPKPLSKNEFYKRIYIKQRTSSEYCNFHGLETLSPKSLELIDPDYGTIKKKIQRYERSGFITTEHYLAYLRIHFEAYPDNGKLQDGHSAIFWSFLNMFNYLQRKWINKGVSGSVIVEYFQTYEDYVKLVFKRYDEFVLTDELMS
ncbi:hypothetical protein [Alginatibacterium sediminis]|uniref:hypothetical protein n=1 Tax=Alginatibacterium sediminis TaxID=2164068 RepID=UPI0011C43CB8|nr:hypothetical protein [Alginatibacterium sediminis]